MAFPTVDITNPVLVYPRGADNFGNGPFAGIVTAVDNTAETIDVAIFPPGKPMIPRQGIQYGDDVTDGKTFFYLTTDPAPTYTTEKTGTAIPDNYFSAFRVTWTDPAGSQGTLISYKKSSDSVWLTPNKPGNKTGTFNLTNQFTFNNLDNLTSYDILFQDVGPNGIASPGIIETATTTTPP